MSLPVVLTVGGLDPTGTVGIVVDLATFARLGVHGGAVATVLTAQDTNSFGSVAATSPDLVREQLEMAVADIGIAAVKLGMLWSAEIAEAVDDVTRTIRRSAGGRSCLG